MITTTQAPPPIDWLARASNEGSSNEAARRNALVSIAYDVRRIADAITAPRQVPPVDSGWREYTPGEA